MLGLPMLALGLFVFELRTLPFQQMRRSSNVRYAKNDRVGAAPGYQFLGPGEDSITLSGVLYPELTGGKWDLTVLRMMMESGDAWVLLGGDGRYYGEWVIESVDETGQEFMSDGSARKIEFSLALKRVDAELIDIALGNLALWL